MAKRSQKRESRYDEYLGIPVEGGLKKDIAQIARGEERDTTAMARILLKEAVDARKNALAVASAAQ